MSGWRQMAMVVLWTASLAVVIHPLDGEASGKGSGGGHHGSLIVNREFPRGGGNAEGFQADGFRFGDLPRDLFDDHGLDDGYHRHGAEDKETHGGGSRRGGSR
jgi:hypothetical protein